MDEELEKFIDTGIHYMELKASLMISRAMSSMLAGNPLHGVESNTHGTDSLNPLKAPESITWS